MVLLTHAYFIHEDPKEAAIMRPYVPLGILYLAAWLDELGIENEVFDTTFSEKELFYQKVLSLKPRYLCIYTNLMTKINVVEMMRKVKQLLPETYIILGGPEVRNHAKEFLAHGADFLIVGEGEESLSELIQNLENGGDGKNLASVYYANEAGDALLASERDKIKDIDKLPLPARHKINLHLYLDAWKKHHGQNAISVSTMRGCPYTCKWCSRAVYGLSYRRRSARKVAEELLFLQQTYNPDTLWFVDDVFTINHKWLREFVEALAEYQVKIPYECITRADRMNPEVIALLKQSGCFRVWIGAESGSQKVIDLMDRRVSVEQVRTMIQLAQAEGIQAGTFIMVGYPGETEEDIFETVHHLKVSNPDIFTITVAYPIKGTELYQETANAQIHPPDWATSSDREIDFARSYPRHYYDYAVRFVVNEVNFYKQKVKGRTLSRAALGYKLRSLAARVAMTWIRKRQ